MENPCLTANFFGSVFRGYRQAEWAYCRNHFLQR
jgi:hypothetical protein